MIKRKTFVFFQIQVADRTILPETYVSIHQNIPRRNNQVALTFYIEDDRQFTELPNVMEPMNAVMFIKIVDACGEALETYTMYDPIVKSINFTHHGFEPYDASVELLIEYSAVDVVFKDTLRISDR